MLEAFGAPAAPEPMTGGQQVSWRAGDLVLKPGTWPELQEWLGTALATVSTPGVRLVEAVPARDGRWVVDGWGATRLVDGAEPAARRRDWATVLGAGRALHGALEGVPRPALLDQASGAWALADRAAWAEVDRPVHPRLAGIARRLRSGAGAAGRRQVVHGDLTGNVLVTPDGPPLVIDLSPYWRPTGYAEGIVLADALTWYDEPVDVLARYGVAPGDVARGLLFRVLTSSERLADHVDTEVVTLEAERYEAALGALGL